MRLLLFPHRQQPRYGRHACRPGRPRLLPTATAYCHLSLRVGTLLLLLSLLPGTPVAAQKPAVPQATLRVEAAIRQRPAESDLGIYLQIPDGGLLPARPVIEVRDAAGRPLESLLLWHTPADALGLVFRPPAASGDGVTVYLRPGSGAPAKPARTTLKPSLFAFTRSGSASLDNARRMATEWPPARDAFGGPVERIGIRWNPFGPDDHFSSWFTGWFRLDARETLYLATISDEGSEVHLDGSLLVAWPGRHTRRAGVKGEYGKEVTLDAGWHRIDYFHFEVDGDQEMCLVWRRGRDRSDVLPVFMEGNAWGRTGRAEVRRMVYADGRVAGWVEGHLQAEDYLWTGSQPVHRHRLVCRGVGSGDGAAITWQFGDGATVTSSSPCTWLVSGDPAARQTAVLSVKTPAGIARQNFRFASFTAPRALALDRPSDRLLYREAFLDRVRAVPPPADPCAAWSGDLWSTLVAVLEPYKGGPILTELFERGWKTLRRLPADVRYPLEDRFAETLRLRGDTARQLAWIARLEEGERDRARLFRWHEERIACHLYDQGDVEAARRAALRMRERAVTPEEIQRAVLRLGDVECVGGNRDQAARLYADAQTRYRQQRRLGAFGESGRPAAAAHAGRGGGTSGRSLTSRAGDLKRSDAWKLYAVNDAAQSATIRAFLEQDALGEAFAALEQWENATSMSKLSGDLLLTAGRVYFHAGDFRRAAALLKAAGQGEAMSSNLPDVMELHLEALMRLKRTEEAREVAHRIITRFPGLPVATRAARLLQQIGL